MTGEHWKCMVCGHVYDSETGDEGVNAGTDFADVPDTWVCPVCGAEKSKFQEIV